LNTRQNEIPTIWTTTSTGTLSTGTWRAVTPIYEWRPSPCHVDCPVDNDIPRWIKRIAGGSLEAAWRDLAQTNPFPAVTGRVCHHPCEGHCNRAVLEDSVGINGLEQFLGDAALEHGWALPAPGAPQNRRVAVVGGGPAGLSCAYHLRRLGYEVTLFESRSELGGLLRYGIPEYRLARAVVEGEIGRILDLGVEVRLDAPVSDSTALELLQREYDAVFLATGAERARRLSDLEETAGSAGVIDGLEYLRRCTEGVACDIGERVVVIGGGSAAMDAARTAIRQGAKEVSVVYRRQREQMPAMPDELEQALEEGVVLYDGAIVRAAEAVEEGATLSCACQKVTIDASAPHGALQLIPVEGGEFTLEADVIVAAIGQAPDLDAFVGTLRIEGGILEVDPVTLATSRPGVFAGGDVASNARYVSVAIGEGRRAAFAIASHLGHPDAVMPPRYSLDQAVNRTQVNVDYFDPAERNERERLPVEERVRGFVEAVKSFPAEVAVTEAARCMTCGACIECDNCFVFCPDMSVVKDPEQDERYVILEQYCKGCGLCAAECPRGVIQLEQVAL
jgi:NADPH-dependent glutamate synthase beta subunit-like oxidoreductase